MGEKYIKRKLVRAFGPWNYDRRDNTYWFEENGQRVKVSATLAERVGIIVRPYVSDVPIIKEATP